MNEEEWSLKNKEVFYDDIVVGYSFYWTGTIEILRKKLIEIIKVHIGEEIDYADPDDIIEEINKLFGVTE